MSERRSQRFRDERGMAMITVAILLPVLVIFTGLAIDTANWWVHKRHLQVQADAAALAGATRFEYPGCDDTTIETTAVEYSGGLDPDHPGVPAPDGDHWNLMPDTTPDVPDDMHTWIQEPNFWGDDGILDDDLEERPGPCTSKFVDVKMTEEDAPGFFGRGWLPEIDAQARVSLKQLDTANGLLPIGVEDVNPVRVHVWMYDEDTGELLGEAELVRREIPENGVYIWDNALGNGDALPIAVANVTSRRIGTKVALSGNADSVDCTAQLVLCYGYGAPIPEDAGKTFARGLGRIRGYDVSGVNPRLGEVALIKRTTAPACGYNDVLDGGYFSLTCTAVDIAADLRGIANTGTEAATVKAFVKDGSKNNAENTTTLAWDATLGRWTGTVAVAGPGPLPVRFEWRQTSGTLENGTACSSNSPCTGTFTDSHAHFSGSRYFSGPIKHMRVDTAGGTNVNNVRRCTGSDATCVESFVVRLGVGGRLELGEVDDDPIALRIFGGGSRNQSLDCDPDEPGFEDEIAYGCAPSYTKNTGQLCPTSASLWKLPQPWKCVAIQTGTATSKPAKGLNQRVLCSDPHQANCAQFGKAQTCTERNKWPDYGPPGSDPRVMALFLVPFGSFDSQGTGTVPVLDFAFFYVTGWHGPGGFQNPCQTEVPSLEDFVEGTESDQGVMSGHFVKPTLPNSGQGSGTETCDVESIGGCVAVMTK